MTTLKDKIRDVVMEMEYHNVKDATLHPEVLVEAIMEEIREYIQNVLLTD